MSLEPRPDELVRQRPGGDLWAEEHRELGNGVSMIDLDAYAQAALFGEVTSDEFFVEYACDSYEHRLKIVREFAVVAIFDRKSTASAIAHPSNLRCLQFHCWLCRQLGRQQPCVPLFFYVIGEKPPWRMVQVDPYSGKSGLSWLYGKGQWKDVWNKAGLDYQRKRLTQYLETSSNSGLLPDDAFTILDLWRIWAERESRRGD